MQRVTSHRCYIVATCDRDLRRRLRKIPGVPVSAILPSPRLQHPVSLSASVTDAGQQLMYISKKRYAIERLADQALG